MPCEKSWRPASLSDSWWQSFSYGLLLHYGDFQPVDKLAFCGWKALWKSLAKQRSKLGEVLLAVSLQLLLLLNWCSGSPQWEIATLCVFSVCWVLWCRWSYTSCSQLVQMLEASELMKAAGKVNGMWELCTPASDLAVDSYFCVSAWALGHVVFIPLVFSVPMFWFTETWCLYGVREDREVLDSVLTEVSSPATGGACEQKNYMGSYSTILIVSRMICLLISWWFFFLSFFCHLPLMISLLCFYCRLVILFTDELGHISHWRAIIAGSLAGMVATVVTYPTDVIKTRLIVQNRLEPSYEGILHAFYKIYHQEGLLALYRGVTPAILGKIILGKMT